MQPAWILSTPCRVLDKSIEGFGMLIHLKAKALMTAISLAVLAGCATSPAGMNAPAAGGAQVPAQWQVTPLASGAMGSALSLDEAWWQRFDDPVLNDLIQRVLDSNL